jgi:hypothetical protein
MSAEEHIERELRLKAIFDSVLVGIVVLRKNADIEALNKTAADIFGRDEESLPETSLLDLLNEKSKTVFTNYFREVVALKFFGEKGNVVEIEVDLPGGKTIPVELNITSTVLHANHLFIALVNDISQRKQLEKELKTREVQEKEIKNELQKEQELNELKSRFVSMASHEFRTPLAGVLSSINLIERYLNAEEENGVQFTHRVKMENHFDKIKESVRNLTQILNEFLSLGKLEEGKVSCKWEEVAIGDLLRSTTEELQKLCKPGQQIVTENLADKTTYKLDYNMCRNIINNLITNAIKYSDAGQTIHFTARSTPSSILLEVRDEGIGIPEDEQEQLFSRFFRAKNVTNIQGTGLGLHIVKKYSELMEGSITFTSKLNQGTTFTVTLPDKS